MMSDHALTACSSIPSNILSTFLDDGEEGGGISFLCLCSFMLFEGTYKMKYTLRKDSVKGVHIKSVRPSLPQIFSIQ